MILLTATMFQIILLQEINPIFYLATLERQDLSHSCLKTKNILKIQKHEMADWNWTYADCRDKVVIIIIIIKNSDQRFLSVKFLKLKHWIL